MLDVLEVPSGQKNSPPNEKDFETMLNYCETWIELLHAAGGETEKSIN